MTAEICLCFLSRYTNGKGDVFAEQLSSWGSSMWGSLHFFYCLSIFSFRVEICVTKTLMEGQRVKWNDENLIWDDLHGENWFRCVRSFSSRCRKIDQKCTTTWAKFIRPRFVRTVSKNLCSTEDLCVWHLMETNRDSHWDELILWGSIELQLVGTIAINWELLCKIITKIVFTPRRKTIASSMTRWDNNASIHVQLFRIAIFPHEIEKSILKVSIFQHFAISSVLLLHRDIVEKPRSTSWLELEQ